MVHVIRTIEAHAGGAAVRLLVEGVPAPAGRSMAQKRTWVERHADQLRRAVTLEPRGHTALISAMLTEAVTPGADAGLIFMDADGYPALSGSSAIAAATVAVERRLIESPDVSRLTFDTVAGTVHAALRLQTIGEHRRVEAVRLTSVPAHVVAAGKVLRVGSRDLRIDLAFGGILYAIVDAEACGIPLRPEALPELQRLARQIRASGDEQIGGVIYTGPPQAPEAHLRSVIIAGARADRSASVTGTSAVMAVLDAMGLLETGQPFVHESLIGTVLTGWIARRTEVGDQPAIVPEIDGSAWITGEQTLLVNEDDPLREGFRL